MSSWETNPWSNFCDPHWEPIWRNKWQPGILEISIPPEIAIEIDLHVGHGNETIWLFLSTDGVASFSLFPSLVSLISDGTVQSENTISFIVCREVNTTTINKTTNPPLWLPPPSLKISYRNRGACKLKKQFSSYPNFNSKHHFPLFLVYPLHLNILFYRNETKRVSLMFNVWTFTYTFKLNSTWYRC